jgi:hypothetical protein
MEHAELSSRNAIVMDSMALVMGNCKNFFAVPIAPQKTVRVELSKKNLASRSNAVADENPRLVIHGNVLYNFNYRSYLDTPFAEHDIIQQSVQTRFDVNIKNNYPFTVYLTHRNSNSAYFLNATDISVQFRQANMLEGIKGNLRKELDQQLNYKLLQLSPEQLYQLQKNGTHQFDSLLNTGNTIKDLPFQADGLKKSLTGLYNEYKTKKDRLNQLSQWLNGPNRFQQLVEEKEKRIHDSIMAIIKKQQPLAAPNLKDSATKAIARLLANGSFKGNKPLEQDPLDALEEKARKRQGQLDSASKYTVATVQEKQKELEQLKKQVTAAENRLKSFQKATRDSLLQLKQLLGKVHSNELLGEYLTRTGKSRNELPALQRALLSIKQIGIGRTWIDYSDLTVKNVSLNGANIELNPSNIYLAAAAGKVNYRFRDFIIKGDASGSSQSLGLIRMGYGNKDRNNLILTYYSGKKALLNQRGSADSAAVQSISGISLESRFNIDRNNYMVAEYARSTGPAMAGKMLDFSQHTNEAWTVKLFSDYPSTHTKITGYYRKMGEGFQSFTLYPTNANQEAWSFKLKQGLWKQKLQLEAAIRKNDFNSPIAAPGFSSSTVFKSFQATVRVKKYPLLTIGFYPTSQLAMSSTNLLYEQQFNTLNAIVSHTYFVNKASMSSSMVYTRFYNSGNDTGFIYYNASSCIFNHSVYLSSFVLQGIVTLTKQESIKQLTVEPLVTYQLGQWLSLTGGVKWSRINQQQTLWGGTGGMNLLLKKIGTLQLQYDKSFLPGFNRDLLPVNLGRITFNREF